MSKRHRLKHTEQISKCEWCNRVTLQTWDNDLGNYVCESCGLPKELKAEKDEDNDYSAGGSRQSHQQFDRLMSSGGQSG